VLTVLGVVIDEAIFHVSCNEVCLSAEYHSDTCSFKQDSLPLSNSHEALFRNNHPTVTMGAESLAAIVELAKERHLFEQALEAHIRKVFGNKFNDMHDRIGLVGTG